MVGSRVRNTPLQRQSFQNLLFDLFQQSTQAALEKLWQHPWPPSLSLLDDHVNPL